MTQKGTVHLLVLLILLIGIIGGVYLVLEGPKIFQPKAGGGLPSIPETSFTLVQEKSGEEFICNDILCKLGLSEQRINSREIKVNLLVRSDIAAANLFSAKLKFPADLLEVESIQTGEKDADQICAQVITKACTPTDPQICKDFPTPCDVPEEWITVQDGRSVKDLRQKSGFIKNWVENFYDNNSGEISLAGGVPNPGIQTTLDQQSPVMATIVFRVKKEGEAKIAFSDDSAIYSNADNLNILTIKRDLDIKFKPPVTTPVIDDTFAVGLEAGAQFDTSKVSLVKESGASWVRLNFINKAEWSGPDDPNFVNTYQGIIDAYSKEGINVIGLIGAESVPGGYDRNNPDSFTNKYVDTADKIVQKFGDRVKVFELFNEPNDWAGGTSPQVPVRYFAEYLEKIYQKVKIEKGRSDIVLISGPLFSFDLTTASDYLRDTYDFGINQSGWKGIKDKTGSYPLDGVGYHMYVAQGMADQDQVENKLNENINAIKGVIDEKDPGKKIWISEVGWGTGQGRATEDIQAANLEKAYEVLKNHGAVKLAMWFALTDFDSTEWGLVRGDGTKKKAWSSFQKITGVVSKPDVTPSTKIVGDGDGNKDGKVDLKDMSILLSKFNTKVSGGIDLNGDETINSFDFSLMINLLKEKRVIRL